MCSTWPNQKKDPHEAVFREGAPYLAGPIAGPSGKKSSSTSPRGRVWQLDIVEGTKYLLQMTHPHATAGSIGRPHTRHHALGFCYSPPVPPCKKFGDPSHAASCPTYKNQVPNEDLLTLCNGTSSDLRVSPCCALSSGHPGLFTVPEMCQACSHFSSLFLMCPHPILAHKTVCQGNFLEHLYKVVPPNFILVLSMAL